MRHLRRKTGAPTQICRVLGSLRPFLEKILMNSPLCRGKRHPNMDLFSMYLWLALFLMLLPAIIFLREISRRGKSHRLPPGPTQLPIIGNFHQLRNFTHRSLWLLSKKHGAALMYLKLGSVPTVVVSSAKMAREVMKTHDLEFCSRPPLLPCKKLFYNLLDVSFAPYGHYWREMRKICILELFSAKKVQSFRFIRDEEVAKMIHGLSTLSSSSSEASNLTEMLITLTNNIVCRAAFGKSYHEGNRDEKIRLHGAIKEAEIVLGAFCFTDIWPWLWWIDVLTGTRGRLEKNFGVLDSFLEKVIQEHLDHSGLEPEQEDLTDVLLRVQRDLHLTRNHVKAIIMDILLAGTGTTSASVLWAMTELVRNPLAMQKAQSEVRRVVGRKVKVDESDIHHLDYLKSVLKETLRLHPPAPLLLPRETVQNCKIDGYDIPLKARVFVNSFAVGQQNEFWENPEIFHPERFENESIDYKGQDFQLIPFGSGRRGCPGIYFAMVTMEIALANLLYSFDWKLPDGMTREEIDMNESFGLVVSKETPLRLVPVKCPW